VKSEVEIITESYILAFLPLLSVSDIQGSAPENRDYGRRGSAALTMRHPSIRKN
jgi:hypothetical protein